MGRITMPATTQSRGKSSATTIYKPTPAAPKQKEFSYRRRSVKKTYGRSRPKREMKQETLTQMDFTSSAMRDFIDLDDDDEKAEEKGEKEQDEDEDEETKLIELEPPRPAEKVKVKANSRSSRRRTAGEELDADEKLRKSKRRKTLGDSPDSYPSSSYHTQTLTQMLSTNDSEEDPWRIEDSQDLEDSKLVMETPRKPSSYHGKSEAQENVASVPSLVLSVTPANRQKRTEVPSSNSPQTPILLRYSPPSHHSPLMAKSTNVGAPSPILKPPRKWPRDSVVPDSYSTAHDSSPVPSEKSTVKATPSKKLRFNIPEDKENITPGRTKPKSPKPKSQPTGRRPLQEVPDSDEDLDEEDPDETEYETEDDEFGAQDPESPTPKRFLNVPPTKDTEPELEPSQIGDHPLEGAIEQVVPSESRLPSRELGLDDEITSVPDYESESGASSDSGLEVQDPHLERLDVVTSNQELDQEPDTEVEAQTPETPRAKEGVIESGSTFVVEQTGEPSPSEQDENENEDNEEDEEDELSPSQNYLYTQGLESQRLPLDSIRALGPQTPHSDIMVSLHPEHIAKIVDRSKNHEFRAWKIPQPVSRIWIYITRPECELKYMCRFSEAKVPGEIEDDEGVGNIEFNQGKKSAKFAYEILQVYELNNPVSLDEMKRKGWVKGAPQKYTYIPPAVVGELTANLRCALFEDKPQSQSASHQGVSESQELKAQLQSDADYSTQHYSEETMDEIIPASQTPRKNSESSKGEANTQDFARPTLSRIFSTSSSTGLPPFPPSQRQRNLVRASQATTVSQASSSPVMTPRRTGRHPIPLPSSSPTALRRIHSSLRSSQFPTTSQMLPDSLLNDDIQEPPPIIWDSADEHSD
ncbi:hypothetical protein FHL15_004815 [Xylaria flabelliformis]|uniref:Uncharacterized protein n=1 Tax=Xylaria flabelliformis TaxID=2512241 RepID=A0A553I2B6_9PEZI|nr:hypothetical protein FHL15_004815 [Xylaria flabelliformis]